MATLERRVDALESCADPVDAVVLLVTFVAPGNPLLFARIDGKPYECAPDESEVEFKDRLTRTAREQLPGGRNATLIFLSATNMDEPRCPPSATLH